ncbi:MAG: enoyl-CoA hydratase/isomerase family protein [Parvibaculaceae bacterium]
MTDEVLFERRGRAGFVTLNRPQALNALTLGMAEAMDAKLREWAADPAVERVIVRTAGEKAFSAGGDVRALYDWGKARDPRFLGFYRTEYTLNTLIKRYPKPYIALIGGIVMGGGVGISVHGSHRAAGERITFAMPETGIGLFPDVGGTFFLPRLPGRLGLYLGLTGARLRLADCLRAGIATHHVPAVRFGALADALCEAPDVDACLAEFQEEAGEAPIAALRPQIDRHFGHATIEAILASLEANPSGWAQETAASLRQKSPTSLKITLRQLKEGAGLDFEAAMQLEFRMVHRVREASDFFEGVRALIIDKDQAPRWNPPSLDAVTEAEVESYFQPVPEPLALA